MQFQLSINASEPVAAIELISRRSRWTPVGSMQSAHRESSVTFLPGKTTQSELLVDPARRFAFELAHHISEAMSRAQSGKDVDVISSFPYRVRYALKTPNHTAEILMDTDARSWREPWLAIFRTKDEVLVQRKMRRGHPGTSRAPRGAQ